MVWYGIVEFNVPLNTVQVISKTRLPLNMTLNQTVKFLLPFRFGDCRRYKHTHTNKQTHTQDRLQYTAPLSLARSVKILSQTETAVNFQ